ncbi:MAG: hypothetical protein KKF67_01195 [Nanoarchaeota archaeon]|nr:hypothetical protein [Nanoarchaeota archaeon]
MIISKNITKVLRTVLGVIIAITLISNFALAQSIIDTNINKEIFTLNDDLQIDATITNHFDNTIYLDYLITSESGTTINDRIVINPDTFESITVYKTKINQIDFRNSDYSVYLRLMGDSLNIYDSAILNFSVIGLEEELNVELHVCSNEKCSQKSKIFLLNEDIYFDYFSEVENPDITAMLIYPNEKTKQITLPTSIKAEQVGTYTIEATASKDGYKTITKREQFGVIEKAPDINLVCNYNGICGEDENHKICPADCPATVSDDIYNIEAECGDSVCQIGENYNSCQADCKNALDGICPDESFICDPDCEGFDHIKCKAKTSGTYILIILSAVLIIIAILVIVIIRKRQKRINHKQIGGQKDMLQ